MSKKTFQSYMTSLTWTVSMCSAASQYIALAELTIIPEDPPDLFLYIT